MAPAPSRLPRNVKLLGAASFLNDVASEIIFPLLPLFLLTVVGANKFQLGIIEGVADSTASLVKLWSGAWSDRLPRRRGLVIAGYALAALVRPWMGWATAAWQVLAARTLDRLGKGIRTAPRDALIADSTAPPLHGRAFGFHRAMDHLGAALGPLLASAFLWWWPGELRTLFLLTLVPGLMVMALLVFGLREPSTRVAATSRPPWTLTPFDARFRWFLLALVVFTLGNSTDAFLLVRAQEVGVPVAALPILWLVFHLTKSFGNWCSGQLVDRRGPRGPLLAGWVLYAAVYLAFAAADRPWHVWVLFIAYAGFYALTEPAEKRLVVMLAGEHRKGLAFGWFHGAVGVAAFPASLLAGALYQQYGPWAAFGFGATMAVVAATMVALFSGAVAGPATPAAVVPGSPASPASRGSTYETT